MCNDAFALDEKISNHMIVCLDLHIERREVYQRLKTAFSSVAEPKSVNPIRLIDKDDDAINRTVAFEQINFEGQIERAAVLLIMKKGKNIFIDPVTNEPYQSIYVFCHDISRSDDWMRKYLDYLALPFVFDKDLLVRLIRDIVDYFVIESKRLLATNPSNNSAALQSS
ncbi:unnamed protein product [Rotaria sordida]|uniref:Uncharacterized protein n=2 Tax=Rotaria sordida TaxID=392033 RepID=A0A815RS76_9BILA|nr:unnamed protein product [Rotaria sordida]CAF1481670.1 unnamed protein product [Rotaria sordida]CAF3820592.1 unnamed protein product [Rotaria sordida]